MAHQFVPEVGSTRPCPHCAAPVANEHSIRRSGLCDGVAAGDVTAVSSGGLVTFTRKADGRVLARLRNSVNR